MNSACRAVLHTKELASACRMNQRHAETSRLDRCRWIVGYHTRLARVLHGSARLAPSQPRHKCTAYYLSRSLSLSLSSRLAALGPRRCVIMGESTRRSSSASSTSRYTLGTKVCTVSAIMRPRCAQAVAAASVMSGGRRPPDQRVSFVGPIRSEPAHLVTPRARAHTNRQRTVPVARASGEIPL